MKTDLLVISTYPSANPIYKNRTGGIAWHTSKTLKWLLKNQPNLKIEVTANIFDTKENYIDQDGVHVNRVWKHNSLIGVYQILKSIITTDAKKVLFPFEFFIIGSLYFLPFYVASIYLARIIGKDVTLIFHNVVSDINVFEHSKLKATVFKILRGIFYETIMLPCNNIIVFEQSLKSHLGDKQKISVIPLAVEPKNKLDKNIAKQSLGLDVNKKYLLYFGFLSLYKGVDDLLNIWSKDTGYELIIAGGENPAYVNDPFYKSFIEKINKLAKLKGAIMTGFVQDDKIDAYFSACEAVVLPYKTFMSSSGPLSIAFSYNVPVILSDRLNEYLKSKDIKNALKNVGLKGSDLLFSTNKKSFNRVLENIKYEYGKYVNFSTLMCTKRNWESVSTQYNRILELGLNLQIVDEFVEAKYEFTTKIR